MSARGLCCICGATRSSRFAPYKSGSMTGRVCNKCRCKQPHVNTGEEVPMIQRLKGQLVARICTFLSLKETIDLSLTNKHFYRSIWEENASNILIAKVRYFQNQCKQYKEENEKLSRANYLLTLKVINNLPIQIIQALEIKRLK